MPKPQKNIKIKPQLLFAKTYEHIIPVVTSDMIVTMIAQKINHESQ